MIDFKVALNNFVENGLWLGFDEWLGDFLDVLDGHISRLDGLKHGIVGEVDEIGYFLLFGEDELMWLLNGLDGIWLFGGFLFIFWHGFILLQTLIKLIWNQLIK